VQLGRDRGGARYLEGVRAACTKYGTILVFDEVITGFRLAPGGAQAKFGVTPDLATFAKAIANGFPVAAIAGRGDILDLFAQGVAHGGTFNGQPIAMAATLATLDELTPELFATIEQRGHRLMDGIREALEAAGHTVQVTGWGTFFHVAFDLDAPARNWRDLTRCEPRQVRGVHDRARLQRRARARARRMVHVASRSPSSTAATLPTSCSVRRSFTIWYGCRT
jgi:glutamate-1-semialdehyde 2,1-aminomutase